MKILNNMKSKIIAIFISILVIILLVTIYKRREDFEDNKNIQNIIDSKYEEIVSKLSLTKNQKDIADNFIKKTVAGILNTKPSKMKPSKRAQKILKENRTIINNRKNIKILVVGQQRHIFDKKTGKLIEKDTVEHFFDLDTAKSIGEAITSAYKTGDWNIKARKTNLSTAIKCIGQEGLNPTCPKSERPEYPRSLYNVYSEPFWDRECDEEPCIEPTSGEKFPDGLYKPVDVDKENRIVILENNNRLTWSEFVNLINSKNQEIMDDYDLRLEEWNNLPSSGYCCYGSSAQQSDSEGRAIPGTCSTEPCKSDLEEVLDIAPGLLVVLGSSLVAAAKLAAAGLLAGITAAAAAVLLKIGLILIAIGIILYIIYIIIGAMSLSPTGKNKDAAKKGYSEVKDLIDNGLSGSQLEQSQNSLEVTRSFNEGETDNVVVDITESDVGSGRVSGGISNGDGYISIPSGIGRIAPDEYKKEIWNGTMGGKAAGSIDCDLIDCNERYSDDDMYLFRQLVCCDPATRLNLFFEPLLPPVDEPQSPSDLPPPPGASSSNDICTSECYNGYNNIVCRDRDSGEEVSRQSTSTRDISCCYNECNDRNTWRIVCNPEFYRDTQTPCYEPRPTKL